MYIRIFHLRIAILAILILNQYNVDGKKVKKNKKSITSEGEETTPQPNVVTYSTFGFNDVRSYDGFVPSSPDYVNYLNGYNQESSTRLYAPAFPTALDSTGSEYNDFGSQTEIGHSSKPENTNGGPDNSMLQYNSNSNFFNTPSFYSDKKGNFAYNNDQAYSEDSIDTPTYGAKINSKSRNKLLDSFNGTTNNFNSFAFNPTGSSFSHFTDVQSTSQSKPFSFSDSKVKEQNRYNYIQNFPSSGFDSYLKPMTTLSPISSQKFPKDMDFTQFNHNYPAQDDSKLISSDGVMSSQSSFTSSDGVMSSQYNVPSQNLYKNNNENNNQSKFNIKPLILKEAYSNKNSENDKVNDETKSNSYSNQPYLGHSVSSVIHNKKIPNLNHKDKPKSKPWTLNQYNNDFKSWQNPLKGYEFSTNVSNASFKYDFSSNKMPFNSNNDEIAPESSNVDLTDAEYPGADFSNFKKLPGVKAYYEDDIAKFNKNKFQSFNEDYIEQLKKLYKNPGEFSNLGSTFQPTDAPNKSHIKKPQYYDELNDDIVYIPKKPNNHNYFKQSDSKPNDWNHFNKYKSYRVKEYPDWNKEISKNRFKSEEDLLGLRTHDTSYSSYSSNHRPIKDDVSVGDYKKLADKWRQSYLKAKYNKVHNNQDFDTYATEEKPVHVPVPKAYPIEIPHPVIIPVPQPYPVQVPVPKPVAVPVIQEITVPIEKPVPYPVVKKIPYPVEKLVPVTVEKQIPVPVVKPYAVPIPHVRPVFHHSKHTREQFYEPEDEEDDYMPRPESSDIRSSKKYAPYYKRPVSSRNTYRRPSSVPYYNNIKGRSPGRRPSTTREHRYARKPAAIRDTRYYAPSTQQHFDYDEYTPEERSDRHFRCKRTGRC